MNRRKLLTGALAVAALPMLPPSTLLEHNNCAGCEAPTSRTTYFFTGAKVSQEFGAGRGSDLGVTFACGGFTYLFSTREAVDAAYDKMCAAFHDNPRLTLAQYFEGKDYI